MASSASRSFVLDGAGPVPAAAAGRGHAAQGPAGSEGAHVQPATRESIKEDLMVKKGEERDGDTWWRVTLTDSTKLERAFLLAGAKTFQNIKFT
jgi:hypothetical protein